MSPHSFYEHPVFPYQRFPDQDNSVTSHHPVIVVGGGLVGLTTAIDLLTQGISVVVLEKGNTVSEGSRSICQAKRTLEIWDRLGAASPMVEKGITWNVGKVFHKKDLLYEFDLLPDRGHQMPAFINLQQYYVEECLLNRLHALGGTVRWGHALDNVAVEEDIAQVTVLTPDGPYCLTCDWLIACDGARSSVRRNLGVEFTGEVFEDKFLITDVKMKAKFPSERWFWFEPPFHDGQTALLHRQADDVWRIDLQLGWDADIEAEKKPERVFPRIRAMLGHDVDFDPEWISLYVFQCRTLQRYVHGPVIFAGDAAHQVSPFGARGGNGGVQDADNLVWKLKLVIAGKAPKTLLHSYSEERVYAAKENIRHSTRATDFMTPKSTVSRRVRDTVLQLASKYQFARALVNSGRLSVPAHYRESSLNTCDEDIFDCLLAPGSPAIDAPVDNMGVSTWWLSLCGGRFMVVVYKPDKKVPFDAVETVVGKVDIIRINQDAVDDKEGLLKERYDLQPGTTYLLRPDQIIAGRWRTFSQEKIMQAVHTAAGLDKSNGTQHG